MKKLLLLLMMAILLPPTLHAQSEKAIWCEGNNTLYFVYDDETYESGTSFEDDENMSNMITAVYTSFKNRSYGSENTAPWNENATSIKTVNFQPSFNVCKSTSFQFWFSGLTALTAFKNMENLDTSEAINMHCMFGHCESLPMLDVSHFNTSNVTTMRAMFIACSSLTSLDLSNWDTSNVTQMNYMFQACNKLTDIAFGDNFNTSKVTTMEFMFINCYALSSIDVSGFDTSNVTSLFGLFAYCRNLKTLDLSNFNTSKVRNFATMVGYCTALTEIKLGENFKTPSATSMSRMFAGCRNLTSIDLSNFTTENVTNMESMFSYCYGVTSLDVSKFTTSKVTNMTNMFHSCSGLTSLDVSGFNTGAVNTMENMFNSCSKLTSMTFGQGFSMDKATTFDDVFKDCSLLRYIDFYASDDTDAITSVDRSSGMFNGVTETCVIFLPHGSKEVTDVTNVVYTDDDGTLKCPYYYSEDKVDIEFPYDFKAAKAEYSRTMSSAYGTVILPYDFTRNNDIHPYTLDEEHTATMYFKDTQTVAAHTPFAFHKVGNAEFIMEDDNFGITVKATRSTSASETTWDNTTGSPYTTSTNLSGWTAKGYYINEKVSDYSDAFYIASDKFYKADGELTMYPHRATFHGTWTNNPTGQAKYYGIMTVSNNESVQTAIEAAELRKTMSEAEAVYDMQGRRVNSPQRGLSIVRMADGSIRKVVR